MNNELLDPGVELELAVEDGQYVQPEITGENVAKWVAIVDAHLVGAVAPEPVYAWRFIMWLVELARRLLRRLTEPSGEQPA